MPLPDMIIDSTCMVQTTYLGRSCSNIDRTLNFYSRSVLMKRMLERSQMAQGEGRQLASEAVINHKTITAFSSQDRMLDLFEKPQAVPE